MANKEVSIDLKLANLQQLQDQLKNLTVNVKFSSPELTSLLNYAKTGITLNIKANLSGEIRQLLDLAKNGINISIGGSRSGGGSGFGGYSGQDQFDRDVLGSGQRYLATNRAGGNASRFGNIPDYVRGVESRQDAIGEQATVLKSQIDKFFQQQELRLKKANESLNKADIFSFGNKRQGFIDQGLDPSKLQKQFNAFDPSRLYKDKETANAFLFSGLLGGPVSTIGAALGGSTLGGSTGVLAGVTVVNTATAAFGKLFETLKEASDAATSFDKSIVALQGILGAETEVRQNGQVLGPLETTRFNKAKGAELSLAARNALLPLGIGGETEQNLALAYNTSRISQGFIPQAAGTAKNLSGLGAFLQLNASDISPQRVFKDLTDILQGAPNARSTSLGSRLAPIVPELFKGKQLDDKELDQALDKLQQYVEALKSGNGFFEQRIRLEGQLQNIQINVGESLNQALVPGLKALNEAVADPRLAKGLENIAEMLGRIAADAIKGTVGTATDISNQIGDRNNFLKEGVRKNGLQNLPGGLLREAFDTFLPGLLGTVQAEDQAQNQNALNNSLLRKRGLKLPTPQGPESELTDENKFSRLIEGLGLNGGKNASNNPFTNFEGANAALGRIGPSSSAAFYDSQLRLSPTLLRGRAASLEKIQQLQGQGFDNTFSGRSQKLGSDAGFIGQRIESLQAAIGSQQRLLADIPKEVNGIQNPKFIQAIGQIKQDQADLAKAITERRANAREGELNPFKGAQGLAGVALAAGELSQVLPKAKRQFEELNIASEAAKRGFNDFAASAKFRELGKENTVISAARAVGEAGGSNPQLAFGLSAQARGAALEQTQQALRQFTDSVNSASRALNNFKEDAEDRKNGRLDELQSAQEEYQKAQDYNGPQDTAEGQQAQERAIRNAASRLRKANRGILQGPEEDDETLHGLEDKLPKAQTLFQQLQTAREGLVPANAGVTNFKTEEKENAAKQLNNIADLKEQLELKPVQVANTYLSQIVTLLEKRQDLGLTPATQGDNRGISGAITDLNSPLFGDDNGGGSSSVTTSNGGKLKPLGNLKGNNKLGANLLSAVVGAGEINKGTVTAGGKELGVGLLDAFLGANGTDSFVGKSGTQAFIKGNQDAQKASSAKSGIQKRDDINDTISKDIKDLLGSLPPTLSQQDYQNATYMGVLQANNSTFS